MGEFEDALKEFGEKLLKSQKPLEPDFQKVLNENIWDLYEETERIFTHQGNYYKVKMKWDETRYIHVIYRKIAGGAWIFWDALGECENFDKAIEKFIERNEDNC